MRWIQPDREGKSPRLLRCAPWLWRVNPTAFRPAPAQEQSQTSSSTHITVLAVARLSVDTGLAHRGTQAAAVQLCRCCGELPGSLDSGQRLHSTSSRGLLVSAICARACCCKMQSDVCGME
jgi:hypothetical protein